MHGTNSTKLKTASEEIDNRTTEQIEDDLAAELLGRLALTLGVIAAGVFVILTIIYL
jgi:hypothetical protein